MHKWPALPLLIFASIFAGLSPAATTSALSPISDEDELLRTATLVFTRAVAMPAAAIPAAVLMRATAIAAVPSAVKDGRRYYGQGVVSARGARVDYWTPPAVIAFEGDIPLESREPGCRFHRDRANASRAGLPDSGANPRRRAQFNGCRSARSQRPDADGCRPPGVYSVRQLFRRRQDRRLGRRRHDGVQRGLVRPALFDRRHRSWRRLLSPALVCTRCGARPSPVISAR